MVIVNDVLRARLLVLGEECTLHIVGPIREPLKLVVVLTSHSVTASKKLYERILKCDLHLRGDANRIKRCLREKIPPV